VIYKLSRRIVIKFGGSSVRDSFDKALELVQYLRENNNIVVVVSALKGVTDMLITLAENREESIMEKIKKVHEKIATELGIEIEHYFQELEFVFKHPEIFPSQEAYVDHMVSFGERLSAELFSKALQNEGIPSVPVDAFYIIETCGNFGDSRVDLKSTAKKVWFLKKLLEREKIPVVTGFLGNYKGFRTTLGRGGSDYTATVIASLLNAKAVAIMSDVNGIYTADPRVVKNALLIPFVSYEEALLASKLGMKALHERTLEPIMNKVPVILGKTENWKLGSLISVNSSGIPIIVYKRIRGSKTEISIVSTSKIEITTPEYPIYRHGKYYTSFLVDKNELEEALNEIHEVVLNESLSTGNDSELWAGV